MTFFIQSGNTSDSTFDYTSKSFTRIDWEKVKENVTAFQIYKDLADATGISLQECFVNNKVDLSKYEVEDEEIKNYISSVPLFSELEKRFPYTIDRSNSLFPTTNRRYISKNMLALSREAYRIWEGFPVENDCDRHVCLWMLKNHQRNRRDKVLLHSFVRVGIEVSNFDLDYGDEDGQREFDLVKGLPCNRDAFFRIFGEYAHKNIKTDNPVKYSTRLDYDQIYQLILNEILDQFITYEEADKIVCSVHKHGLDHVMRNGKQLLSQS